MVRRFAVPVLCVLLLGLTTCGGGGDISNSDSNSNSSNSNWIMATAPHAAPAAATGTGMSPAEQNLAMDAARWVNGHRTANGLAPLAWATNVAAVADGHAATMASLQSMDHGAGGTTLAGRLATGGVGYSSAAENIAWNYLTGQAVAEGWMNSTTGHREAILGDFTQFGLAVRHSVIPEPYWCCVFIKP